MMRSLLHDNTKTDPREKLLNLVYSVYTWTKKRNSVTLINDIT